MKHTYIVALFLLITTNICVSAEDDITVNYDTVDISEFITVEMNSEGYKINFNLTNNFYIDTIGGWSKVIFPTVDNVHYMEKDGYPYLPIFTINLPLPFTFGSTIAYSITNVGYDEHTLRKEYLPYQYILNNAPTPESLTCDASFYKGDVWKEYYDSHISVSQPYTFLGSRGITVNIQPFTYNPQENILKGLSTASININLPDNILSKFSSTELRHSNTFYDVDPLSGSDLKPYHYLNSKYLIIIRKDFETDIDNFVQYRSKHNTTFQITSIPCGESAESVRNLIRTEYRSFRPDYILIVGDPDCIPYSAGILGDSINPATDIYYSCLEKDYIQEEDLAPDVMLGRWPVDYPYEVRNITNKIIAFESRTNQLHCGGNRAALFSGSGSSENTFYHDILAIRPYIISTGSTCNIYDGRNPSINGSSIQYEMNNNLWLLLYSGHGSEHSISDPYSMEAIPPYDSIPPISMLMACSTFGADDSFGEEWICGDNYGGVSAYGATSNTYTLPDRYLSKNIFQVLEGNYNYSIGNWLRQGEQKYYRPSTTNSTFPYSKKHQILKYNFFGDPSMRIYGRKACGMQFAKGNSNNEKHTIDKATNNNIILYPTITDDMVNISNNTSSTYNIKAYDMQGKMVMNVDNIQSRFSLASLQNGIYVVHITSQKGKISYGKIIVQH